MERHDCQLSVNEAYFIGKPVRLECRSHESTSNGRKALIGGKDAANRWLPRIAQIARILWNSWTGTRLVPTSVQLQSRDQESYCFKLCCLPCASGCPRSFNLGIENLIVSSLQTPWKPWRNTNLSFNLVIENLIVSRQVARFRAMVIANEGFNLGIENLIVSRIAFAQGKRLPITYVSIS